MKKVAFYTLGCKLNFSETSTIGRLFETNGFQKVEFQEKADVYVINTCSVTENADKKCKKVVKEALKYSPDAFIAVIGCYAQLKPKEISEIPGVDAVLGAAEKFRLIELLGTFEKKDKGEVYASEIKEATSFNQAYSYGDRTRTFLKVQDGCDYSCSFCTIPLARGNSRSDTIENIIAGAREIAATEVKEVVLTGVNIGDYGIINGERVNSFFDLVKELDYVDGIERIRISSIEPNLLTNEIINFVSKSNRFAPHFHIPLQSGSNKMLKLMRRRYQRELYKERVEAIKAVMPDCCIGVDVIVGFNGETHEDFLDTYNFLNELEVSYLHVFTYSERANTHAVKMPGKVPMNERNERSKMLRSLSEKKRRKFYEDQLSKTKTVLFEADEENGMMFGFTENYVKVTAKYDPVLVNEMKKIKLMGINNEGIVEIEEAETEQLIHR
ncbi:2-methylthioadenine synthetase [Sporocytophaga myxococcoides]|uniref:Threonylcarbamoyladenosine tRNA methylthiotransferase MtaB n=1 Tax=Sporocytophaga myxococcoides TaxID=153721 RepID=A0A098L8Y4_9BACT|nr:tRNA (N(6)-L-threonylcarbamoyladenosine(37)-C(2))-methylthiotransferase MtaB [Sporocytophaga myxococcoides]GAL83315.1 2-methylthioadenine synthetase [Sporocytophaga myxococcoides]